MIASDIKPIAPHAQDRTQAVADWLLRRKNPNPRNAARAFLLFAESGLPAGVMWSWMAKAVGLSEKNVACHLTSFNRRGIIRMREGRGTYYGALLGERINPVRLLDLLGRTMEEPFNPNVPRADRCRHCANALSNGHCRVCAEIEAQPWLANRLNYLQERARLRLPLFGEPVPWQGGTDLEKIGQYAETVCEEDGEEAEP